MAQIPRPPKQGSVATYQAKVAAGYLKILASEMDADLDTIYGAWNGGADTVNLRDGCVTSAKLAADSVGPREIADGGVFTVALADWAVTTPKLADAAVTDPKIVSVSWGKVTGSPGTYPPTGTAGGDLSGSYPNPAIRDGAVTAAKLAAGAVSGGAIAAGSVGSSQLVDGGVATGDLADAAVTRVKLAPGALPGAGQIAGMPSFTTSTPNTWLPVVTLPALTTRGANQVFLFTNHGLSGVAGAAPGDLLIRWVRNGAHICNTGYSAQGAGVAFPLPTLPWVDLVPSAGTYTYQLQVFLGPGMSSVYFYGTLTGCIVAAYELG